MDQKDARVALGNDGIFLCHASEDKAAVIDIYRRLQRKGLRPWLDKMDLRPGQAWDHEIRKAIRSSRFVLVFLSSTSVAKRGYVQKEFALALDVLAEMPEGQIFIIPVRLDDCEVPDRFRHLHYADLFDSSGLDAIIAAIKSGLRRETIDNSVPGGGAPQSRTATGSIEDRLVGLSV
jgi:hypothetical protein